ncbi:hypothetical protein [Bdellovibrio sp.]|uniref:hypothetical protein n=1 Tax=Bdellovibrio sp. TaxID=28201 RepID=UPI0039E4E299
MKTKKLALAVLVFLSANQVWAASICNHDLLGNGKVVVKDSQSITVSGLEDKGIKSGTYGCLVMGVGPGVLSVQSKIRCENTAGDVVMGWLIEGLNAFGMQSASVALYVNNEKVFESGCSRK